MGFGSVDSATADKNILEKIDKAADMHDVAGPQWVCSEHGQTFSYSPQAAQCNRGFHSMYIVVGILRDLEVIRSIWRMWVLFMQILDTVSYKGLEHLWVLVLEGALEPVPVDTTVCTYLCILTCTFITHLVFAFCL